MNTLLVFVRLAGTAAAASAGWSRKEELPVETGPVK